MGITEGRAFVSLKEAAKFLGVSANTLRAECRDGEFPHVRIGRNYRISAAYLERLAETGARDGGSE